MYCSIHLPKDICSMYRVLFTFGTLLYITYLQYVPGTVRVWKAAVHYISAKCTGYGSCLEGCCTLHICSMYRALFMFGRLLYITYLQYVPGTVHIWNAAVHYIYAVCTRYDLHLEGCCTLHICSMYPVRFTFGRPLYITYMQYVPHMIYIWKAAVHYISTQWHTFDFTYFNTVVY